MRVFIIFELFVIVALLYLAVNLIRYFFFKESGGNVGLFGLSNKWIEQDAKTNRRKR